MHCKTKCTVQIVPCKKNHFTSYYHTDRCHECCENHTLLKFHTGAWDCSLTSINHDVLVCQYAASCRYDDIIVPCQCNSSVQYICNRCHSMLKTGQLCLGLVKYDHTVERPVHPCTAQALSSSQFCLWRSCLTCSNNLFGLVSDPSFTCHPLVSSPVCFFWILWWYPWLVTNRWARATPRVTLMIATVEVARVF